jgi:hypothetical protein
VEEIGTSAGGGGASESIIAGGRSGAYAYIPTITFQGSNATYQVRAITLRSTPSELWARIAVGYIVSGGHNIGWGVLNFYDGATLQIAIGHRDLDKTVRVYRGTTEIASGGTVPATGFVCIEAHLIVHNTTGVVTVWVNGVQVINFTGNTRSSSVNQVTEIRVGLNKIAQSGSGAVITDSVRLDDLAINDTTGSVNNGQICQGGIYPLFPSADTADKDFARSAGSDNYLLVNSRPPDDDTTYVQGVNSGDLDLYTIQSLSGQGQIDAVTVLTRMKSVGGSGAKGAPTILSGGTASVGSQGQFGNVYAYHSQTWERDPNTTATWSYTAIASLQIGVTVQ